MDIGLCIHQSDIYNYYRYEIVHQFGRADEYNVIIFNDPVVPVVGSTWLVIVVRQIRSFLNTIFKAIATAMIT